MAETTPHRAVFLDRDGTIIEDLNYLTDPEQVRLLSGAAEALRRLRAGGYRLILVTNQSGLARGLLTEKRLAAIHARLAEVLAAEGAALDGLRYCPHLPDGEVGAYARECNCRKPKPGMLLDAAVGCGLDLSRSVAVGDAERDVESGRAAGCRTIRLSADPAVVTSADAVAPNLAYAADIILEWDAKDEVRMPNVE